jgi:2-dehydro-3-deoxygluconokinase
MTVVELLVDRWVVPLVVLDDVGLAQGLANALIEDAELQSAVEYGAAHGALAMTTPGGASMATLDEVLQLAGGGSARDRR